MGEEAVKPVRADKRSEGEDGRKNDAGKLLYLGCRLPKIAPRRAIDKQVEDCADTAILARGHWTHSVQIWKCTLDSLSGCRRLHPRSA